MSSSTLRRSSEYFRISKASPSRLNNGITPCASLRNVASVSRFLTVTAMSIDMGTEESRPDSKHSLIVATSAGISVGSNIFAILVLVGET